jgi:hypothetical protein
VSAITTVTVRVPLTVRHRPGRKTIVTPGGATPTATRADPAMLKALARAFRWKKMLETKRYASIGEIARAEKIDRTYVGDILRLTLLAPDIVKAILDGRQPDEVALPILMKGFPMEWERQHTVGWLPNLRSR